MRFKKIIYSLLLLILVSPTTLVLAEASTPPTSPTPGSLLTSFGNSAGLATNAPKDPLVVITGLIKIVLGFLSVVFLILIIVSGWQWMMAGGDAKKIEAAKQRIINATIGLVIVLAAYGITTFISAAIFQAL